MTTAKSQVHVSAPLLQRRHLLKAAVAGTVLAGLPWGLRRAYAQEPFDVVVIGGGTAGLPAAIHAANRGARVAVIEIAPVVGGTLYLSGGLMAAADTVFQRQKGIEDSPDAMFDDVMRISNNTANPTLVRLWANHGGPTVNWLAEHGFKIKEEHPITTTGYDPYSIARYLSGPERGVSILNVFKPMLAAHSDRRRLVVFTETSAVDLTVDRGGAVTGVIAEDAAGEKTEVSAANVILSSGGCAANPVMFQDLHGIPLYQRVAYPFSQGTGLSLGRAAGGYLRGAENYVGYYGSIANDNSIPSAAFARMSIDPKQRPPWEVFVNARGERFVREDHPSVNARDRAMDLQPGHRFWAVFDQQILEQAPPLIDGWSQEKFADAFESHPMFTRAESLSQLGVATGIDPAGLARSIQAYNRAQKSGARDPVERDYRPLPLTKPPFYAIRSQAWTLKSYAGLAVNGRLQVVNRDGRPIPNLYAAGEVLGAATSGKSHTSGGSVTPAVTFGRLLGQSIALQNAVT